MTLRNTRGDTRGAIRALIRAVHGLTLAVQQTQQEVTELKATLCSPPMMLRPPAMEKWDPKLGAVNFIPHAGDDADFGADIARYQLAIDRAKR